MSSLTLVHALDKAAVVRLYPDPPPFFTSGCGRVLPAPAQTRSGERTRGQAHLEPGKARHPLGAAASRRRVGPAGVRRCAFCADRSGGRLLQRVLNNAVPNAQRACRAWRSRRRALRRPAYRGKLQVSGAGRVHGERRREELELAPGVDDPSAHPCALVAALAAPRAFAGMSPVFVLLETVRPRAWLS